MSQRKAFEYWSKNNKWFLDAYNKSSLQQLIHGPIKLRAQLSITATMLTNSKKILDLGCGPSRVLYRCLSEGEAENAIGLDFSANMLEESHEYLKQKGVADKVELIECDLLDKKTYPEADLSIALGLFDYVPNPKLVLSRAHKACKYSVTSWCRPNLRNFLRKFRYTCPVYTYTEKQVREMFYEIGVKNVHIIEAGGFSGFITICSN